MKNLSPLILFTVFLMLYSVAEAKHARGEHNFNKSESEDYCISDPDSLAYLYYSQLYGFSLPPKSNTDLLEYIKGWMGVPYKFGGNSEKGIDCSRFVSRVYSAIYDVSFNGASSRDIFKLTSEVGKENLQEGDLVFFKIGKRYISHMGIYLGAGMFAHAASSKGVSVSRLDNPYFSRCFYKAGRIF